MLVVILLLSAGNRSLAEYSACCDDSIILLMEKEMELLNQKEIEALVNNFKINAKILKWSLDNYSDKLIGYLGEHLKLTVEVETNGVRSELKFFVKCMPRFDTWKANYLKELLFFKKEYIMLSKLFKLFESDDAQKKWRPKLLYIKEDVFVFEDVAEMGYKMSCHLNVMSHDEIMATVKAIALFHAQSIIYEEKKSKELNRPYSLYEDFSEYLQEPPKGKDWRDAGRNAVIDFLKVYSKYRSKPNFSKRLEVVVPMLFEGALTLMKPSTEYRNVVVHRDLWTNNIFLKRQENGELHALIVDFQTVLYCPPMIELSSMLFFNTTKDFREMFTPEILDLYYKVCSEELKARDIDINYVFDKATLLDSYEQSIMFGITQAAIIVPIVAMSVSKREQLFENPELCEKLNVESRSQEFIEIAKEERLYCKRVTELFDEIVERYVFPTTEE